MKKNDLCKLWEEERKKHPDLNLLYVFGDMSLKYMKENGEAIKIIFHEDNKETIRYYPEGATKKKDSIVVMELQNNGRYGVSEPEYENIPKEFKSIVAEYQFGRSELALPLYLKVSNDENKE